MWEWRWHWHLAGWDVGMEVALAPDKMQCGNVGGANGIWHDGV